ncbi:MAG TPA: TVP38/TMEM64 family protein [Candidatus Binataceae bacterium]|nr:TVP38/TMEM64 family protein [Candidatus Binataceae bacterium]
MAAVSPIGNPARKPGGAGSLGMTLVKIAIVALIVGGSVWLLIAHREWFTDPRLIKREVLEAGVWAPIVYMLMYAVGPSFLVPGAVMTIAGGLAFGTVWGSVYSLIGADAGAIIAFGAGRFLGRSFVERVVGPRFHAMLDRIARNGFVIILYLRFVPVIPYNALNLLAGASPITFRDYFWASMIGMVPGTILFAFLGDALWHPMSWRFVLALALIAASVGCGEIWRRWSSVKLEA